VLISQDDGDAVAYALWKLQERGRMFVEPGDTLYEGMVIGIHSARQRPRWSIRSRSKKLTNVRASGKDEAIVLTPPIQLTLEIGGGVHRRRRAGRDHAASRSASASAS
jgi:GTP-binding protein